MTTPPPEPPDAGEYRAMIDQWAAFVAGLSEPYIFDLDNWLNDVDLRQLIHEANPMFGVDEVADAARKLEEADRNFLLATHEVPTCLWGSKTARREHWTAARNWWYFRAPLRSNAELDEELARIK